MTFTAVCIGLIATVACGWLAIRCAEGAAPVLSSVERCVSAVVLGPTMVMAVLTLLHVLTPLQFDAWGFAIAHATVLVPFGGWWWSRRQHWNIPVPPIPEERPLPSWIQALFGVLLLWTAVKILGGVFSLVATPVYQDDAYNNWNMRGKLFWTTKEWSLVIPRFPGDTEISGVSSYPPSLPLVKTYIATLSGFWNEPLINGIHGVWYLGSMAFVFFALRRAAGMGWALLGVYLLGSLPLFLIQGTAPYADVFVAAHVAAATLTLLQAFFANDTAHRLTWLRISGLATALMIFTKNETLLIHLPILMVLTAGSILWMTRRGDLSRDHAARALCWTGCAVAAVALPWLLFKWSAGLTFGNAKSISGMELHWQEHVLRSLAITWLFEGNWHQLLPLLMLAVLACWRAALRPPLLLLTAFCGMVVAELMGIFLFTGLSTEALRQTGSGRGIVQILPVMVTLFVLLMREAWLQWGSPAAVRATKT